MKKEIHHKVPTFLRGSDEDWNKERITVRQHLLNHLEIAKELDTFEAWACCIQLMYRAKAPKLLVDLIKRRFGRVSSLKNGGPDNGMRGERLEDHMSEEAWIAMKQKQSKAKIGKNSPKFKGYYVSPIGQKFESARIACEETGVPMHSVGRWSYANKNGWSFEPTKDDK